MHYHIDRGGKRFGPYSLMDLVAHAKEGSILPNDLVWAEGMQSWVPVSELLGSASPPIASPLPPPTTPILCPPGRAPESAHPKTGYAWWFDRGAASLITVPVFLLLIIGSILAFIQGAVQAFAYIKVLRTALGFWGILICLFVVPFTLVPGSILWAAIKELPKVIQSEDRTRASAVWCFIFGMVFLVGTACGIQWLHGRAIGWIADHSSNATFNTGVTGSGAAGYRQPQ